MLQNRLVYFVQEGKMAVKRYCESYIFQDVKKKMVSCKYRSTAWVAEKMPVSPPITNIETKASAWSIGVVKRMEPRQSVPSQLNVLIADGTAIMIVEIMKLVPNAGFIPLVNMWWAQTRNPSSAIPMRAYTIEW